MHNSPKTDDAGRGGSYQEQTSETALASRSAQPKLQREPKCPLMCPIGQCSPDGRGQILAHFKRTSIGKTAAGDVVADLLTQICVFAALFGVKIACATGSPFAEMPTALKIKGRFPPVPIAFGTP